MQQSAFLAFPCDWLPLRPKSRNTHVLGFSILKRSDALRARPMVGRAPTMRISPRRRQPADPPHGEGSLDTPRARRYTAAATLEPRSTDVPPRLPGGGGCRSCSQPACASSPPPDHGKGGFMRIAPPRLPREGGGRPPRRPPLHGSGWRLPARAGGRPPHTRVEAALVASCPRLPGGGGHSFRLARRFTEAAGGGPPGTRERGGSAATLEPRSTDVTPRLPGGGGCRSCSQPACASSPPPE